MKLQITIEVERETIVDADLRRVLGGVAHVIDIDDVGAPPLMVARHGDPLRWSYRVEEVTP